MRRAAYPTLAIIAGAILLVSLIALRRHLPYTGTSLASRTPPPVVLAMENAYLVGLSQQGKLWSARARSVRMAQNRYIVSLEDIHDGKVFDSGKVALKVRAGRADYGMYARNLSLSGGIRVEGSDGQKISAPDAVWNWYTGMLRSRGGVTYESPWGRVTASAIEVNLRSRRMRMWNGEIRASVGAVGLGPGEAQGVD